MKFSTLLELLEAACPVGQKMTFGDCKTVGGDGDDDEDDNDSDEPKSSAVSKKQADADGGRWFMGAWHPNKKKEPVWKSDARYQKNDDDEDDDDNDSDDSK